MTATSREAHDDLWAHYEAWCEASEVAALPPAWTSLVLYISSLERAGESARDIGYRIEALGELFRERGLEDTTGHARVIDALKALEPADAVTVLVDPPEDPQDPGLQNPYLPSNADSVTGLELAESQPSLPPVLAGHDTPAMREAVGRFFASVHAMFEAWLARRQSPHTRRAYRRDVLDFVEFLGLPTARVEVGDRTQPSIHPDHGWELLQATVPQVQAWRDFLSNERNAAPNTLNRRISSVSGFFRFMREAAAEARLPITVPNPAHSQFISREVQEPVTPTEALTATRARQLMALPEGESELAYRDRALLKFY